MSEERVYTREDLPEELNAALEAALDKSARGPVVLRLTDVAGYTDWALILSGRSDRHVAGITDGVLDALVKLGRKPIGKDGLQTHNWDLLDFDDFLVHVFYHPVRSFYDLESMWNDAPRVTLELADDIMFTGDLTGLAPPEPMPEFRGDLEFGGFRDEFDDDDDDDDDEDGIGAPVRTVEDEPEPASGDAPNAGESSPDDDLFED